jgi:hypothetical protein
MDTTELDLLRRSTVLRFLETASNDYSVVHHFEVLGTPFRVLLHEGPDGKLFAVWQDPSKRYSWEGRYPRLVQVFPTMPAVVQSELCRLRPLLSRRLGEAGQEYDMLDGLCAG